MEGGVQDCSSKWEQRPRWKIIDVDLKNQRQFQRLLEMLILKFIDDTDPVALKRYRIQVKDRVYRFNFVCSSLNPFGRIQCLLAWCLQEALTQLEQKERQAKLEETFQIVKKDYIRILNLIHWHSRTFLLSGTNLDTDLFVSTSNLRMIWCHNPLTLSRKPYSFYLPPLTSKPSSLLSHHDFHSRVNITFHSPVCTSSHLGIFCQTHSHIDVTLIVLLHVIFSSQPCFKPRHPSRPLVLVSSQLTVLLFST